MKTQIIKLEEHDDLISIRDKMGWGKTGRILLVWPEDSPILLNRLEITLLQRHSQALGAQLGLITRDGEIRTHASELGIPTYRNLHQAQQAIWRTPRRIRREQTNRAIQLRQGRESAPRLDLRLEKPLASSLNLSPAMRWIIFALGVLAVVALGAVIVPRGEIRLQPEVREQELEFIVRADPQARGISLAGVVPSEPIMNVVEGRDQLTASGSTSIPDQPAGGLVVFTNLSDREVTIPSGLVVSTPSEPVIRFGVTRQGVLAAGPGTTLNLPVRALEPGAAGNIAAGAIQAIEGPLGIEMTATNPRPFSGGRDIKSLAPRPGDYARLSARLTESLRQTALSELRAALEPGDVLIASSLALSRTLEEIYQPAEIQPANELSLNLRLEYSAQIVRQADLARLAEDILNARLPDGFTPQAGSLLLTSLDEPEVASDGKASWSMLAIRHIQAAIALETAVQLAMGLEPQIAAQKLSESLPLAAPAEIQMQPDWWPRIPMLPFRIHVVSAP